MAVVPSTGAKEVDVCVIVNSWHKQITGKGCGSARAKVLGNMLVVEMSGFLTKQEEMLAATPEGAKTVRRLRDVVVKAHKEELEDEMSRGLRRSCRFLLYKIDEDLGKATLVMLLD